MRKNVLRWMALLLLAFSTGWATAQTYSFSTKGPQGFSMPHKDRGGVKVNYSLKGFSLDQFNHKGETLSEISFAGLVLPNRYGCPNLPTESRMIAIPQGAKARLTVVSCEKTVVKGVNMAPALRPQPETEEPDMNYVKDSKVYATDAPYPQQPFVISETASMRGVDIVTLSVTPFQYNPVTKDLTVYSDIELSLDFEGGNGHFGNDRLRSSYWDPILAAELMNYDQLPVINYEARMQDWLNRDAEGAEYLIVTPNNNAYVEHANQLRDFRTRQGILTKVIRLDEMGASTTNEIKAWFHNAYNTWEIAPVAVCLLADHGTNLTKQIPAETVPHPYSGSCITDNHYADPTGDNLPDMCFSRLIAQDETELPIFVGKQLQYEQNPVTDPDFYKNPITALGWQTERWFQICSEVAGGYWRNQGKTPVRINAIYEGTPGNIWSSNQNTPMVVNYFGPNGLNYIPETPAELGGWSGGTAQKVVEAINNGAFVLQHRDHGMETGWGEPDFGNSNVSQLTNVGKLPFVMSINCLTGKFNYSSDCLMEAFMRRTHNNQNAGAVGVLCPTEVSFSFVNDTYVWGVYDLFDPNFLPDYGPYADHSGNWMPAFGNVAGKYFLKQSSWPFNQDGKDITYTMFTAHCDAFLRLYSEVPQEMDVIHPEVVLAGLTEVNVTAPEGCTISLVTANPEGEWNIIGVAQATGAPQNITIPSQVPPTEINIVCTGQNYLRYEDVMMVVSADGPYIVFDSKTIHDTNNNGQLDYDETITLDVTMKNVGSEALGAFDATLNTTSEYITITKNSAQFESIAPNTTGSVEGAFSFTVANNIPDNTNNLFTIVVVNGDKTYTSNLSMKAYAPSFKITNMSINDTNGNNNGRLEPGETAILDFTFKNEGHSDAAQTAATLQMMSPYITVSENAMNFNSIAAGSDKTASFEINVSENTPLGYTCPILFDVKSGHYTTQKDFSAKVGLILEDFETGELGEGWTNNPAHPWIIVTENPYEGTHCLKSGETGDSQTSTITLTHDASSEDEISFYYKVSSENYYDKLLFYIDDVQKGEWSGNIDWTQTSYTVTEGTHTYKWQYKKDVSISSGSDCAWIDYISLPSPRIMAGTAGWDVDICSGNTAQIVGYAIHHESLQWTTAGDGSFNDNSIAEPIYTPGSQDLANKSVVLAITISGNGETITDDMTVHIFDNITITNALSGMTYCGIAEPQEVAVTIDGEYASLLWTTEGDGTFENASNLATTYTPGANDIAQGNVTLVATAETMGCGPLSFDYPFEMNQAPVLAISNTEIDACADEPIEVAISLSGSTGSGHVVNIDGADYTVAEGATSITLPAIAAAGQQTFNIRSVSNQTCTKHYSEGEFTFTVNVNAAPTLTVANAEQNICQGETATVEINFTGTAPFNVHANGMDDFTAEGNIHSLNFTENVSATLVSVTDANGCQSNLETAIRVVVIGSTPLPINGPAEVDSYLTPTSEYSVDAVNNIDWSISPAEAGTLAQNDGKLTVTWSSTFKGMAKLKAAPADCPNVSGTEFTVQVKNSYDVDEFNANARIYPNPAHDKLNIAIDGLNGTAHIGVYNILGEKVISQEKEAVENADLEINVGHRKNGTYIVKVYSDKQVWTRRFVVEK